MKSDIKGGMRGFVARVVMVGAMLLTGMEAMAQYGDYSTYNIESQNKKVYTEWGIGIGAVYTGINSLSSNDIILEPRFGFQGHLDMAVCFGRNFAIETEIAYEGGSIDAKHGDLERRIKSRGIDVPVLLSLRMANNRIRLSAGPLFTVMSSAEYSVDGESYFFGAMTPTWNLAAGLGVRLSRHFIIEARYIHPLQETTNQFGASPLTSNHDKATGVEFDMRSYKVTAGITLLF